MGDILDVFVHGRRAPGNAERLVVVTFDPSLFMVGDPQPLTVCICSKGKFLRSSGWWRSKCRLGFPCAASEPLTLYAGQPDPDDASHFTIRYSAGRRSGIIDGWLIDGGNDVKMIAHDAAPAPPGLKTLDADDADGRR
jgi:hypothetical protein